MPHPSQKVAQGRALRSGGKDLFTKSVHDQDSGSEWEDNNGISDSDSEDAHNKMRNLFAHTLKRHLQPKSPDHYQRVCSYLMLLNLFINQMTEKVKKQKVMRSSVYTGDSCWTDLRRRKAQQELAEAAKGMHQLTSFFSVSDFGLSLTPYGKCLPLDHYRKFQRGSDLPHQTITYCQIQIYQALGNSTSHPWTKTVLELF
jgi:hypothetical protein